MAAQFMYGLSLLAIVLQVSIPTGGREIGGVDAGLTILSQPTVVIAQRKRRFTLNCTATTLPQFTPLRYTWLKNKVPIQESGRLRVSPADGALFFKKVTHRRPKKQRKSAVSDQGIYECIVQNERGSVIARRVELKIPRIDRVFTRQPQNDNAWLGGVARFQCEIGAVPPPMYIWEKDEDTLPQNNINDRYLSLDSGVLQISNVMMSDKGSYRCRAFHGGLHELPEGANLPQAHSKPAWLNVTQAQGSKPPRIKAGPVNTSVLVGGRAVLECLVDGSPTPQVSWTRQDTAAIRSEGITQDKHNNLHFFDVREGDEGVYVCTAFSPGLKPVDKAAKLSVHVPPRIVRKPDNKANKKAMTARFVCRAMGKPKPRIRWLVNSKEVKTNGRIQVINNNDLVISHPDMKDSGYYQCIAENEAGYDTAFAYLDILRSSGKAPYNVTVLPLPSEGDESKVQVMWNFDESPCCPLVVFTVFYSETGPSSQEKGEIVHNIHDMSTQISHLRPFTNYTFYVIAMDTSSGSDHSEYVTVRTQESVPRTAPKFELSSRSPTSILIRWEPLSTYEARGILNQYQIYYRHDNTNVMRQVNGETVRSYLITGLQPDTSYDFRLLAGTSVGFPDLSHGNWPWQTHHTDILDNRLVPHAPQLTLKAINNTSVMVTWLMNRSDGKPVDGYTLIVAGHHEQIGPIDLPASDTSYTFTNLVSEEWYEVTLLATNNHGSSPAVTGNIKVSAFDNNLPPPLAGLRARILGSTQINITWDPPAPTSGNTIMRYMVRYVRVVKMPDSKAAVHLNTTTNNYMVVPNLMPFTTYLFSVRAHTANSTSQFSQPISIQTDEDLPSAPRDVQYTPLAPDSIELSWQPPEPSNGRIIAYVILYSSDENNPEINWLEKLQNGTNTRTVVDKLTNQLYYFKLHACTKKGRGSSSRLVSVYTGCPPSQPLCPTRKTSTVSTGTVDSETSGILDGSDSGESMKDQLGIVIGITIAALCIIICIIIILRKRCFSCCGSTESSRNNGSHCHENGTLHPTPCNGGNLTSYTAADAHELNPMLQLPENENSDSKGGTAWVISANGPINGLSLPKNNHVTKNHMTSFTKDNTMSEQHALLSANPERQKEDGSSTLPQFSASGLSALDNIDSSSGEFVASGEDLTDLMCRGKSQSSSVTSSGQVRSSLERNSVPRMKSDHSGGSKNSGYASLASSLDSGSLNNTKFTVLNSCDSMCVGCDACSQCTSLSANNIDRHLEAGDRAMQQRSHVKTSPQNVSNCHSQENIHLSSLRKERLHQRPPQTHPSPSQPQQMQLCSILRRSNQTDLPPPVDGDSDSGIPQSQNCLPSRKQQQQGQPQQQQTGVSSLPHQQPLTMAAIPSSSKLSNSCNTTEQAGISGCYTSPARFSDGKMPPTSASPSIPQVSDAEQLYRSGVTSYARERLPHINNMLSESGSSRSSSSINSNNNNNNNNNNSSECPAQDDHYLMHASQHADDNTHHQHADTNHEDNQCVTTTGLSSHEPLHLKSSIVPESGEIRATMPSSGSVARDGQHHDSTVMSESSSSDFILPQMLDCVNDNTSNSTQNNSKLSNRDSGHIQQADFVCNSNDRNTVMNDANCSNHVMDNNTSFISSSSSSSNSVSSSCDDDSSSENHDNNKGNVCPIIGRRHSEAATSPIASNVHQTSFKQNNNLSSAPPPTSSKTSCPAQSELVPLTGRNCATSVAMDRTAMGNEQADTGQQVLFSSQSFLGRPSGESISLTV